MNDLTWSGQPSRRWLFKPLPQLLQRLHAGLNFLGVGPTEQDVFFAELSILIRGALNPILSGERDRNAGLAGLFFPVLEHDHAADAEISGH